MTRKEPSITNWRDEIRKEMDAVEVEGDKLLELKSVFYGVILGVITNLYASVVDTLFHDKHVEQSYKIYGLVISIIAVIGWAFFIVNFIKRRASVKKKIDAIGVKIDQKVDEERNKKDLK